MSINFIPPKTVEVPDIQFKRRIDLHADKTALIVIDMQNDFVKEGGSLVVPSASDTIPKIQRQLQKARDAGVQIIYTQDTQIPGDPEFDVWPEHCLKDSWGWEIIEELSPQEGDLVCPKNRYDGFYGTWMEHFLTRIWKLENVFITGTVSNICVLHTAASAGLRWLHVVAAADGMSALTDFEQALTLHQIATLYGGEVATSVDHIHFT
ncbi:isochorismatase family protein [candidate division KSB1 bacterium]|nr:isochorismatase family protein [candidate division KSB1 bacterium]